MKIIDDKSKKTTWYNRNYFFAGTLIIIAVNILLFHFLGYKWTHDFAVINGDQTPVWDRLLFFDNVIRQFMNSFAHLDWSHVIWNMVIMLVLGLYIERKTGTFGFLLLELVMALFTSWIVGAGRMGVNWVGHSCICYGFDAYVIVDYCFSFQKNKRNMFNTIFGAVVLGIVVVSFFWGDFPRIYPGKLVNNLGHYTGFVAGLVFSLTLQLTDLFVRKRTLSELKEDTNESNR